MIIRNVDGTLAKEAVLYLLSHFQPPFEALSIFKAVGGGLQVKNNL
jgi:hypothetical protein